MCRTDRLKGANIRIVDKRDCPDPRAFTLEWEDEKSVRINLDQGLGTWTVSGRGSTRFDVDDDASAQAVKLTKEVFDVRNRHGSDVDSPIWVTW